MGYIIQYQPEDDKRYPKIRKLVPIPGKTVLCVGILLAVLVSAFCWRNEIGDLLIPGDPYITKTAIQNAVEGMREGESIVETAMVFCQEIVLNGSTKLSQD